MRILLAQINPTVADLGGNTEKIVRAIEEGREKRADIVLFPELALTGYPPQDFLLLPHFLDAIGEALEKIVAKTEGIAAIVGVPRREEPFLYNSAAVIVEGTLLGYHDKVLLPTYDVFNERRYFQPGASPSKVWEIKGKRIALSICEDIWGQTPESIPTSYLRNPIEDLEALQPDLLLNLSSSPFSAVKTERRYGICRNAALALGCPMLLCNQVGGNDSLIFDGYSFYVGAKGELLGMAEGFKEDTLLVDLEAPAAPKKVDFDDTEEIEKALVLGIRDYFRKSGLTRACLGLSGGIDSAVVAVLAAKALGAENVVGVMMPSRYTTKESIEGAHQLAKNLGIAIEEVSIEPLFTPALELLTPHFQGKTPDVTEENMQSRLRGMILMALSNKHGWIVLNTGNKSEMAMGYATLYGDMIGGLGVLSDVTKGQVYDVARLANREREVIPQLIIDKPPSAELSAGQKDSDTLPDYSILDAVLECYVVDHEAPETIAKKIGVPLELVQELVGRIHFNEYKRRQAPPGLRISEKAFSVGRHFPIVHGR